MHWVLAAADPHTHRCRNANTHKQNKSKDKKQNANTYQAKKER